MLTAAGSAEPISRATGCVNNKILAKGKWAWNTRPVIAALYVDENGPYVGLPNVECWGITRDARKYNGPWPTICHPPCQRWGRYATGGPRADPSKAGFQPRRKVGDDEGCFAAALESVRTWGGVLEHPEASKAWAVFGLNAPPRSGGWITADFVGGWTCCVEQGHYGHGARKATWLYFHNVPGRRVGPPSVAWGSSGQRLVGGGETGTKLRRLESGFHSAEERAATKEQPDYASRRRQGVTECLPKSQRHLTPVAFRNLLIEMVEAL